MQNFFFFCQLYVQNRACKSQRVSQLLNYSSQHLTVMFTLQHYLFATDRARKVKKNNHFSLLKCHSFKIFLRFDCLFPQLRQRGSVNQSQKMFADIRKRYSRMRGKLAVLAKLEKMVKDFTRNAKKKCPPKSILRIAKIQRDS